MWDSRAKKYFKNIDDYDDAMVLFQKFNQLKKLSFEDVQGQLSLPLNHESLNGYD